jgi:hypothetical protein
MKMKNLGMVLLGFWLIIISLRQLLYLQAYMWLNVVVAIISLAAGALILWSLLTEKGTA